MGIQITCYLRLFRIVGNEMSFNDKVTKVYNSISNMLDYPADATYHSKYLIQESYSVDNFPDTIKREVFTEVLTFLDEPVDDFLSLFPNQKRISYVKKRVSSSGFTNYSHIFRILSDKHEERLERRRHITKSEYLQYLHSKDPERNEITRFISVFVYNNSIYTLETDYINRNRVCKLLRVNSKSKDNNHFIPDFLPIEKEVTSKDILPKETLAISHRIMRRRSNR